MGVSPPVVPLRVMGKIDNRWYKRQPVVRQFVQKPLITASRFIGLA
jgi:hypothetical protein